MLLCAALERARQAVRCLRQRGGHVAARQMHRRRDIVTGGMGGACRQQRRQRFGPQLDQPRRAAGSLAVRRHRQADHLAGVEQFVLRQQWLVLGRGRQQGMTRDVGRQHQADHAGQRQRSGRVESEQASMRQRRQDRSRVQRAGQLGQVVDEGGRTRDMGAGALVRQGLAAGAAWWQGRVVHGRSSVSVRGLIGSSACRPVA